ncbi:hypothetical protein [Actinacidiphila bryophytorum]|uniref:hypothetical protein n=1 Tax=Actinacidiphila bryophytorum TaxID=1436133 RepID=UPI002176A4CE|nr:hypothetical protein [Actinacidiphila bryophytorum]UWE07657.1 hypothetical protein NYE86_02180 [Actinacidiphila bryophytorum]
MPVRVPAVRPELSAVAGAAGRDVQRVALIGDRGLELRAAATPQQPEPQAAEPAVVPVVWTRPAQPTIQPPTQRLAGQGPGAGPTPSAPVQRLGTSGGGQPPTALADVSVMQRFSGVSAQPGVSASPMYGLGITGGGQPPTYGLGAPGGEPGSYAAGLPVQRLELPSAGRQSAPVVAAQDAGDLAVGAGIGTREPDGSVVFAPPATVQREPDAPAPAPAPAPEAPAPEPPAPAAQPAASPGPPPPAAAGESTDELVRRLLAPLTRLLRAELRLDRERAGMRLDSRH